jgi:hypothetical protein
MSSLRSIGDYVRKNPVSTALIVGGTAVAAVPAVAIVPVLAPLGFTAGGVLAGEPPLLF